jgi:hypothetical protein
MRRYQNRWMQRRREEWIRSHGPCVRCGSWENLEVDHKDHTQKLINISNLWSLAPDNPKRVAELAKCQVLCHVCHVTKTNDSGAQTPPVGERHGLTHLTEGDVRDIRHRRLAGETYRELAERFSTGQTTIKDILRSTELAARRVTGTSSAWSERCVRDAEVIGSTPVCPTRPVPGSPFDYQGGPVV